MSTFSVWAPAATGKVEVEVAGRRYPMSLQPAAGACSGWWSAEVPDVAAGIDYGFSVDGGVTQAGAAPRFSAHRQPLPRTSSRVGDIAEVTQRWATAQNG